jgi:hypothetical protein
MFLKKYITVLLLSFLCSLITSQLISQPSEFIHGKVTNSDNHEPVPFATVKLKYNQLGVYANAEGDFKIIRNPEFQTDSVIITCIGFRRLSVAFKDLNWQMLNRVTLTPVIYGLTEVKVIGSARKLGSLAIIRRAIKNIKKNYPVKSFDYVSYYRDYQKHDGEYINLNEAIVQVIDNGFGSESVSNRYHLLDFRKNLDFARMNITPYYSPVESADPDDPVKYIPEAILGDQYGNELFVLMVHDAIRNFNTRSFSFIENFSEDFINNHNFSEPAPVYNNNLLLFKIIFNGKTSKVGNSLLVSGAIYIQPKSYSIHKIEYSCSYQSKGKGLGEMFNVDIEYGLENSVDSLMCLKYISFNNFFKVIDTDDENYFKVSHAYIDNEHYINPTLVVEFNGPVDPVSAVRKKNYEINFGEHKVNISSIQAGKNSVFIRMKEDEAKYMKDSCKMVISDVKDLNGNILDKRKTIDMYQYRELFVQEYNKSLPLKDSCYMEYKPLEENCRSTYTGNEKYWMNTPVNEKITKQ